MKQILKTCGVSSVLALTLGFSGAGHAMAISDIDLSGLSFEVDSVASGTSATGTSNGIGYTFDGVYFTPLSNTTGSQSYNDLPGGYDDIHAARDFTLTFSQPIDYMLFALGNDSNTSDGPNFNLAVADSVDITQVGTQLLIDDIAGALALFVFDSPITSITHINDNQVLDGFEMSFFAGVNDPQTDVPEPSTAALGLLGLLGLYARRRASSVRR